MKFKENLNSILIILIGAILFLPFLGNVNLFDWDEINFAECAREMLVTRNYSKVQINFLPFYEKPPLFIWMQALSMHVFGVNEFAARFPNAICGILTLLVIFKIGSKMYNTTFGWLWVLMYIGSFLPHIYFKSGIIDPWFNLFIFLGIYFLFRFLYTINPSSNDSLINESKNEIEEGTLSTSFFKNKLFFLLLATLFNGLAILTKGPVSMIIIGISFFVYWSLQKFKSIISFKYLFIYVLLTIAIGSSWFVFQIANGNSLFVHEFIVYQIRLLTTGDAGHSGPFYYHVIVLLIGCFPASLFALKELLQKQTKNNTGQQQFSIWMTILLFVGLVIFSIVKTKIIHYSSICYFPLTYLAAISVYKLLKDKASLARIIYLPLCIIGLVVGIAFSSLQLIANYKEVIISSTIVTDIFAIECLKAKVLLTGMEFWAGIPLILISLFILVTRFKTYKTIIMFFISSAVSINIAYILIIPRVEEYTQHAAIEFYESLQHKNCHIKTLGFKSYAYLFYSKVNETQDENRMLVGVNNKPCYFVIKINEAETYKKWYPAELKEINNHNGYVFFERRITTNP